MTNGVRSQTQVRILAPPILMYLVVAFGLWSYDCRSVVRHGSDLHHRCDQIMTEPCIASVVLNPHRIPIASSSKSIGTSCKSTETKSVYWYTNIIFPSSNSLNFVHQVTKKIKPQFV